MVNHEIFYVNWISSGVSSGTQMNYLIRFLSRFLFFDIIHDEFALVFLKSNKLDEKVLGNEFGIEFLNDNIIHLYINFISNFYIIDKEKKLLF